MRSSGTGSMATRSSSTVWSDAAGRPTSNEIRGWHSPCLDETDGYVWVGLTGVVEAVTDRETTQADIAEMCRRYHADDPAEAERIVAERFERQDRISFRFRATSIHDHLR